MHVGLRIDPRRARVWHRDLVDRLRDTGHAVTVIPQTASTPNAWPDRLLWLEARLRGLSQSGSLAPLPFAEIAQTNPACGRPAVILDLDADEIRHGESPVWQVSADGRYGTAALLDAATCGRTPVVAIRHGTTVVAEGRPGSEAPDLLHEHAGAMLGRCTTLILTALAGHGPRLPGAMSKPAPKLDLATAARLASTMAGRRLGRRLHRLFHRTPHWRVGWRRIEGPDLFDLRRHPEGGWHDLPDDGHRFYADPFPLLHAGQLTLFVEDYVHATGRGCIAAVPFGPDGPLGAPEPVLERPYHLSYPFVFAEDGDVWMIPETGEAGTIELYRATRFPGGWIREAVLVSGLVAGDATLHRAEDGRWWMFATVKDGGAASDALHLWSAPDFRGPWSPHRANPVLVDIASARPAGRMVTRGGTLLRPVQDCRAGYGAALGIARITKLDDDGFAQAVETTIGPGAHWLGTCLHTLTGAGGFEFIDGSGRARRPWGEMLEG